MSAPTPLTNSTTVMPKATYVPLAVAIAQDAPGGAVRKSRFVQTLNLQPGEVAAAAKSLSAAAKSTGQDTELQALLARFEGSPPLSQLPSPTAFIEIADTDLTAFGGAVAAVRKKRLDRLQAPSAADHSAADSPANIGAAMAALNLALVSTAAFSNSVGVSPIGMLNLESLEMTPAGIERGGLLATVPLAPGEHTEVVQREWTVVNEEFTSIVTDALTDYSETGVTEATQLTQATTSQVAHSNQFNVNASVSGGIGIVTGSASSGFTSQDQNSKSASESSQQAQQTTKKAASRVTESHKMTISTSSESGSSDTTTRQLVNPSKTEAMRIDYFSMMRKWMVALYRYGLRLTYDITVPEPGAAMRKAYRDLARLQEKASEAFDLDITYGEITPQQYPALLQTTTTRNNSG